MAGRGAGAPDAVLEKLAKVVALIQSSERAEQEAGLRVCINLLIPALVGHLKSEGDSGDVRQTLAVWALSNLGLEGETALQKIVDAGAVSPCLTLLADSHRSDQLQKALALATGLALNASGREQLVQQNATEILVSLLSMMRGKVTNANIVQSMRALRNLANNSKEARAFFGKESVAGNKSLRFMAPIDTIITNVGHAGSGRDALSAEACLLLAVLMKDENQLRKVAIDHGIYEALKGAVMKGSPQTQLHALWALMAVSELEETIPDLVGCHLVPVLLDLIRTDAEEVSSTVRSEGGLPAVHDTLLREQANRFVLRGLGTPELLQQMSRNRNTPPETAKSAMKAHDTIMIDADPNERHESRQRSSHVTPEMMKLAANTRGGGAGRGGAGQRGGGAPQRGGRGRAAPNNRGGGGMVRGGRGAGRGQRGRGQARALPVPGEKSNNAPQGGGGGRRQAPQRSDGIGGWHRAAAPAQSSQATADAEANNNAGMTDRDSQQFDSKHLKRTNIVREMMETEKTYLGSLQVIIDVFYKPLTAFLKMGRPIVSQQEIRTMFSFVEVILKINSEFYNDLKDRLDTWSTSALIGDVFLKLCQMLPMYSEYINNYNNAMETLSHCVSNNKSFREFMEDCTYSERCKGLDVSAFLILPIQRVPRYQLLLTDLVKNTSVAHPDYRNLTKAVDQTKEVADKLNEAKRTSENLVKVLNVQQQLINVTETLVTPGRQFLKEGGIMQFAKRRSDYVYLFLFSDCLLITEQKKNKFKVKDTCSLKGLKVIALPDEKHVRNAFRLLAYAGEGMKDMEHTLMSDDPNEKAEWEDAIREAARMYKKNEFERMAAQHNR